MNGGVLILLEGFKSLVKIGVHFYNSWIDGMKESAAISEQNAASIREAAQANEELEAELREIENENRQQTELRDKAGIPVWFGGDVRLGGKETIEAAGKKIEENNKRAGEIRRRLHEEYWIGSLFGRMMWNRNC